MLITILIARRHVTLTWSGVCAKVLSWLRSILSVVQRTDLFLRQLGVLRTKLDHALLSPKTLVSPAIRNKIAVPTDIGSDQGDERILHERGVSKRGEGHQRIVLGREDQCWHVDLSCNGQRTPSTIIIGRVAVTPFRRRYRVVPFPQGSAARRTDLCGIVPETTRLFAASCSSCCEESTIHRQGSAAGRCRPRRRQGRHKDRPHRLRAALAAPAPQVPPPS